MNKKMTTVNQKRRARRNRHPCGGVGVIYEGLNEVMRSGV